jgi:hypothetical protein
VAGILGLGVAAASGGLAAATAVGAGTLALLSISWGFAAGSFATIKVLNAVIAGVQAGDPTHVTLAAEIVNVAPSIPTNPPAGKAPTATPVTLTVKKTRVAGNPDKTFVYP